MFRSFFDLTRLVLIAILLFLVLFSTGAQAATITTLSYGESGRTVGTYAQASDPDFSIFTPITAITTGSIITLTFPTGTTLTSANLAASDFTIIQATQGLCVTAGSATAPSAISVNEGNRTVTLTVAANSLSTTAILVACGLGEVTIRTSGTLSGNEIRHSTTTTSSGTFQITTSVGDSGSISSVSFIPDAPHHLKVTGSTTQTAGATNETTATAYDQYDNVTTSYSGSKTLTFSGLSSAPDTTVPTIEETDLGTGTSVNFTNGVSSTNATTLIAYKVEIASLDVTDGTINTTGNTSYDLDLTVSAAAASELTKNSGDGQSAAVNASLTSDLVVKLTDAYENPISGSLVSFTISSVPSGASGQSLTTTSDTTDVSGLANTALTLGNTAGSYQVQATVAGVGTVTFSATATDGDAPIISSINTTPSSTSIAVTWTTNEPSSTKLNYGLTSAYGSANSQTDTSPRVTSHGSSITGLLACTTYHLQLVSIDYSTNQATSDDQSVTTGGCLGSSAVSSQTASSVAVASGGNASLLDSGKGLGITIPSSFAASDAEFQIKKLGKTEVLSVAPLSSINSVGDYFYVLDALSDPTTKITSFNQPITVEITYGDSDIVDISTSTLRIYRWTGSAWSELSSCSVNTTTKVVSCTTTAFSVFTLVGQSSAEDDSDSGSGSGSGSGSIAGANTSQSQSMPASANCESLPPGDAPWLYAAEAKGVSEILLYFGQASNPVTHYVLEYGLEPSTYLYGAQNVGDNRARTYLVNNLQPNTKYYFRVRASNGCATGSWSNEISALTLPQSFNLFSGKTLQIEKKDVIEDEIVCNPEYKVKVGDTYWKIAEQNFGHGFDFEKILTRNSLVESDMLQPGQVLNLPCTEVEQSSHPATQNLPKYTLKIKLVDSKNEPLKNMKVTLFSTPRTGVTDENGELIINNVEHGNHRLVIAGAGYEGEQSLFITGEKEIVQLSIQVSPQPTILKVLKISLIVLASTVVILFYFIWRNKRRPRKIKSFSVA